MINDLQKFAKGWGDMLIADLGYESGIRVAESGLEILQEEPGDNAKAIERVIAVLEYLRNKYAKSAN